MNEKRTDFATILCWIALGIAGLAFAIFLVVAIVNGIKKIKYNIEHKNDNLIVEEVVDPDENTLTDDFKTTEYETNDKAGTTNKVATVESHYNYMQGYEDGNFGPNDGITRAQVAAIFARLDKKFDENKTYRVDTYSDVKDTSWYSDYVGYCAIELIMTGYNDGTYHPNEKMKKIEFLAAAVRYVEADYFGKKSTYSDTKGTWADEYIGYLQEMGYISGKTQTTLGAQDPITRAEVCSVLNALLGRKPDKSKIDATQKKAYFKDVSKSAWYYYDVVEATTYHDIDLYHNTK